MAAQTKGESSKTTSFYLTEELITKTHIVVLSFFYQYKKYRHATKIKHIIQINAEYFELNYMFKHKFSTDKITNKNRIKVNLS